MKNINKYSGVTLLLIALLAGCQSGAGDCLSADCGDPPDRADSIDTLGVDASLFEIEIVGEGQVVVNGEPCTTANGICSTAVVPGTAIVLEGDFTFVSETGNSTQEGRCIGELGCHLEIGLDDVHVVADVEPDANLDADIERRPFGLLPGQPGVIVDDFHHPLRGVESYNLLTGLVNNQQ